MTDEQLDALEAKAKAATPGPWTVDSQNNVGNRNNTKIVLTAVLPTDRWLRDEDAAFIAAANPAAILDLISQIRACHELIEVLTEAGMMTESVAFPRTYFNRSAYAEICRNIPELRQKAGLSPLIGDRND